MSAYSGKAGEVGILSVGAGDTKLSFDKSNPAERIRAARIVRDMLRRGYALLIEVDVKGEKKFVRATDFDEGVCEYVIADMDPTIAAEADQQEQKDGEGQGQGEPSAAAAGATSGRTAKQAKKRIPAESTRAVAVGRTAGG